MATPFATARVTAYYRTYPLQSEGDADAVVYHMVCEQNETSYNRPGLGDTMSSANNAKVIELPWTNGNAYFIGDYNNSPIDGGLVRFDRRFATMPKSLTAHYVGSRSFPFPGKQSVVRTVPASADAANDDRNLWRYVSSGGANTKPAALYMDTKYWRGSDNAPTIPDTFAPTLSGSHVDFVSNGGSGAVSNGTALNGEEYSGSYSVSATSPSAAAYATAVTAGTMRVVDVVIEQYLGDIWVMKTYKMKSQ